MKILVAFECSGTVRDAFRALGHDAWSCDLKPSESPGNHLQCDAFHAIKSQKWDMIIMHPTCTALTVAGNHVYAFGKPKHNERLASINFVRDLWFLATSVCKKVCMENPQGVISTNLPALPKPQYIQPYQFGDNASKKTGLWLYGLPPLVSTWRVSGRLVRYNGKVVERWDNQCDSGQNKLGPSDQRAALRSKTYPGIAKAMAGQWSE